MFFTTLADVLHDPRTAGQIPPGDDPLHGLTEILTDALDREPRTLVDLLGTDEGADIEFQPERLGLIVRIPDL